MSDGQAPNTAYRLEHLFIPMTLLLRLRGGKDVFEALDTERPVSLTIVLKAWRYRSPFDSYVVRLVAIGLGIAPLSLAIVYYLFVRAFGL